MGYYTEREQAFESPYLSELQGQIQASPYLAINNLNRDFVDTKGFSVVFKRTALPEVTRRFPWFRPYLEVALLPECNAFYLNPLLLKNGSRVDPHIDRSLRSYCKTIDPPSAVSVLYVVVPTDLDGGELILRTPRKQVGQICPQVGKLVLFQGDLTHSVRAVKSASSRLSLVCEQYCLDEKELSDIPELTIESRAVRVKT